jgi:dihydrolipoamide dehydrogenase
VKVNNRGQIEVDHDFRTGIPGVYAIGDVVPGPMLAHKAEDEGVAVAEILAGQVGIINHDVIPSVVYTYPEIAAVGRTEEDLRAEGIEIKTGKFPMMANSRAKTNRDADGFVKVISDARSDRCSASHHRLARGTMIAQAAQAMEFGATSETSPTPATPTRPIRRRSRKRRWR